MMAPGAILAAYFGWPLGAVYSNLVASAICAVLVYLRMRAKLRASQVASMAQAARHHRELLGQADEHHAEMKRQAEKHHQEALDRMDVHHEAMKAHVTRQPTATVALGDELAQQVAKVLKREPGLSGPLKGKAAKDG